MIKYIKILLAVILLQLVATPVLNAQSKSDLERKRAKLQNEIRDTNKKLKSTQKTKSTATAQLNVLKKKIALREELIVTINKEVSNINAEIDQTTKGIRTLESDMEELKNSYAEMIRFAQKNQNSYQRLSFIFAAADFNQAYKRLQYIQQYSEARKMQAQKLDSTQQSLKLKKENLESQKSEKTALRESELKEQQNLNDERKEKDKLIAKLKANEKKLRTDLANKRRAKKKLDKAIDDLIKKEIEAAKRKAKAAGKKNVTSANVFSLTPEAKKLSASFAGNMGKLPWPVANGKIVSSFGDHPHPELKGIVEHNNGVDIRTSKASTARALFDGEVTGIITIPGANSAIIIRHGEYLTVYSNLEAIFVNKGDKVTTKQSIGRVFTDPHEKTGEIHLEIWKGTSKLNPAKWLTR
jgi:murein hydrolase activator